MHNKPREPHSYLAVLFISHVRNIDVAATRNPFMEMGLLQSPDPFRYIDIQNVQDATYFAKKTVRGTSPY